MPLVYNSKSISYISDPVVFVGVLDGFKGIADDDHKEVHHDGHGEDNPEKYEKGAEKHVELHHLLERIRYLVAIHNTEETEVGNERLSETIGRPKHSHAEHAEPDEERKHVYCVPKNVGPGMRNCAREVRYLWRMLDILSDADPGEGRAEADKQLEIREADILSGQAHDGADDLKDVRNENQYRPVAEQLGLLREPEVLPPGLEGRLFG